MGQAAVNGVLAHVRNDLGDHEGALRHARAAIELNQSLGDRGLEALEQPSVGQALMGLGRLDEAAEVLDRAWLLACQSGVVEAQLLTLLQLAELARHRGDPAHGRHHAVEALVRARRYGYQLFEAEALTVLAELGAARGEPDHETAAAGG